MGDAVFSLQTKSAAAAPARGHVPIAAKNSNDFIAEVSAEERQLASDLAAVLANKPLRSAPQSLAEGIELPRFRYEPESPFAMTDRGFDWQAEGIDPAPATDDAAKRDAAEVDDLKRGMKPVSSAQWLKRAHAQKSWARLRRAAVLALAFMIVCAIAAAAGYFYSGVPDVLQSFNRFAAGTLL